MNIGEIDPLTLDSIPFPMNDDGIELLPRRAGIYFAIAGDKVIYVGEACHLYWRLRSHEKRKLFAKHGCTKIAWFLYKKPDGYRNGTYRRALEIEFIHRFCPVLNVRSNPNYLHHKSKTYQELRKTMTPAAILLLQQDTK